VDKKFPFGLIAVAIILGSTNSAYATNHNTSIFSDAQRYTDSNSYTDTDHTFSIQPPLNWTVLNNIPPSVSKQAIVIFSNNDKTQLATFGIYHRYAINSHSDNDVLATIAQEMSDKNSESQTIVFNGVVDRYNDGTRVTVSSATRYTSDNATSLSENIIYFLNNGNQYTLDLTTNPNSIDKNSQLFEDSVGTFVVNQVSPVPEFPISLIILMVGMFSIIFISRTSMNRQ
jgi:hypothetical protein